MPRIERFLLALMAVTGACQAAEPPGHAADHHPHAMPQLMAFHDLMEPLWHSPPGGPTNARACTIADEIVVRAKAAAISPTPDYAQLVGSAKKLKEACVGREEKTVGVELDRLHTIFHRLAGMGK